LGPSHQEIIQRAQCAAVIIPIVAIGGIKEENFA
jgi:thiamine monophosphate synthase